MAHGASRSRTREIDVPQVPRASTEDHAQEPCRAGDGTDVALSHLERRGAYEPVKRAYGFIIILDFI